MAETRIEPLTHSHLEEWYGDRGRGPTVKGIAGFVDGKLVAVAGVMIRSGKVLAFCDLREEARPYKHHIHRTAMRILSEAKQHHRRIIAYCDRSEEGSAKWLARLGFREEENGVWAWNDGALDG